MRDVFDKYLAQFLDYLIAERNASAYTIRNYRRDLHAFADFARQSGVVSPKKVDKLLVRRFLNLLSEKGAARSSIARHMSAIRSFFRYFQREEIISKNPAATISSPKLDKRLPAFLTIDEARRLIETPHLPKRVINVSKAVLLRNIAMLELLYASGLRVSELVGLDLGQVDMDTNEIRVWGKGSKERVVLMGEPAAQALSAYLGEGRPHLLREKKSDAFFITRDGERILARRAQKILEKYARSIGKKVHPHTLRHTFATHLLDGGADLRVVQELLGHAQLTSTQIYTHVTKSQARKIYLAAHPMAREKSDENR